jgi:superfamily II DNA or RNA helicase
MTTTSPALADVARRLRAISPRVARALVSSSRADPRRTRADLQLALEKSAPWREWDAFTRARLPSLELDALGPLEAAPVDAPDADAGAAALLRWAGAAGLNDVLSRPVSVLELDGQAASIASLLAQRGVSLRTILKGLRRLRGVPIGPSLARELTAAALAYLAEIGGARLARRRFDAGAPDLLTLGLPDEGAPRALFERLLDLRSQLATQGAPLTQLYAPDGWVESLSLERGPVLRYRAAPARAKKGERPVALSLPLDREVLAVEGDVDLAHARVFVEAALELCREPTAAERALLDELGRPAWQRLLDGLERAAPSSAKPDEETLSFHLEPVAGGLSLTVRRHTGTSKRGRRTTAARALRELGETLPWEERVLLEGLSNARASRPLDLDGLSLLVGHPRVFLAGLDREVRVEAHPLVLAVREVPGGYALEVELAAQALDPELLLAAQAAGDVFVLPDPDRGRVRFCALERELRPLLETLASVPAVIPHEARDALLVHVGRFESALDVDLPPSLRGEEVEADPTLRVRLFPRGGALHMRIGLLPVDGGGWVTPGLGAARVTGLQGGKRVEARRDLVREVDDANHLTAALGTERGQHTHTTGEADEALELLARLRELEEDPRVPAFVVEWPEGRGGIEVSRQLGPEHVRVLVAKKRDWFALEGEAAVDEDRVQLALLLAAARAGRRFVELSEGRYAALSEELLEKLRALSLHAHGDASPRLGPEARDALDELEEAGALVDADERWSELIARIDESGHIDAAPPSGLNAELRAYQREGVAWMKRLAHWGAGCVLADDMGLGKTVQSLAMLVERAELGPQLVVAPTSVAFNWAREAERFAPGLRVRRYAGASRKRLLEDLGAGDVLVCSWAVLARDEDVLEALDLASVVFDEAQAMKNSGTRRAKAARGLNARWRLSLTGTPIENHLGELWSIFAATHPGLLGGWEEFRRRFALPIERDDDARRKRELAGVVRPFLLRRTKSQVLTDLPPRTEVEIRVDLSDRERRHYDDVRLAAAHELERAEPTANDLPARMQVLRSITRLRLAACHPALEHKEGDYPARSAKLDALAEILSELSRGDHRALVFSQFTRHLRLAREVTDELGLRSLYLDGGTPAEERERLVERFQAGEGDCFFISLRAGGTGLNLTAADYVVLLDPWWNPAVEDQAADRTHRIGQTRPVTLYRLISRGTIEEQIVDLHREKRALTDAVLEGAGAAGRLSTEELVDLVRGAHNGRDGS